MSNINQIAPNTNVQKLYNALSQSYDVGTLNDFSQSLSDPVNRQKAYKAVSSTHDAGSFDDFSNKLGYSNIQPQPIQPQPPDATGVAPKYQQQQNNNLGFFGTLQQLLPSYATNPEPASFMPSDPHSIPAPLNVQSASPQVQGQVAHNVLAYGLPMLAAPLGGIPSVVAAGVLGGVGEHLGQQSQDLITGKRTPESQLMDQSENAAIGTAAGQAVGATGIGILNKLSAPFAGQFQPEIASLGEKYGMDLPASALSTNKNVGRIEALADNGQLTDRVVKLGQDLNGIANNAVAKLNNGNPFIDKGQQVADSFNDFVQKFRDTKDALYNSADIKNSGIQINPEEFKGKLNDFIDDLSSVQGQKPKILSYLNAINKSIPDDGVDVKNLIATLKDINTKTNFMNSNPVTQGYEGRLKGLASSLDADITTGINESNPQLGQSLSTADQYYADNISKINSQWGRSIQQNINNGTVSKIPQQLLNPNTPTEYIPQIFSTIGDDASGALKSATLEKMFSDARNPATGMFQPQGLANQINKYGSDKLDAIFGEGGTQTLQDMSKLSMAYGNAQKVSNGSQTGFLGKIMAMAGALTTNPVLAVKLIATDQGLSKFISSKVGQQWLTTGYKVPDVLQSTIPAMTMETGKVLGQTLSPEEFEGKLKDFIDDLRSVRGQNSQVPYRPQ